MGRDADDVRFDFAWGIELRGARDAYAHATLRFLRSVFGMLRRS